ncbi:rhodanese-like domain-containing protein [Psychroserpens sp.]|uniref:rhodanese-like domain-containing protein n=1 Tax=Psychroserpens sp. TaxID=2020870 RepID=UPI001B101483|nr:rhodanese-like domain-containing protein [Psychroserpens sp.]MBO6607364.1 rhodanese-like domain-containing protein [Psychroserpens sp.]MBO6632599.1 rhodanese-like domain-containing protein [Psychroserpens sp.]MBO6654560.1 rhodanese-like domain-containing protein [Psychroserpens sp.]MBO6681093.1 rhodanese-like domain-containing protein [Psychroserpens sp.]MBO6749952.1 rhodanese-like domain-containing protein [Psychroserpens sp.]
MSLLSLLFGKRVNSNESIKVLNADAFRSEVEGKKVQLVDVRTKKEFNSGHIKGAINIDYFSGKFTTDFNRLNKQQPIFIYCRSGGRSRQAAKKLSKLGFEEIYDLKGGIINYK